MIFEYVDIDYKDSRLGVRFEPKNEEVAAEMVLLIPSELRFYHRDKRRWILDPSVGPIVMGIIVQLLPDCPIQIEEKNRELILSLLFGPDALPGRAPLQDQAQAQQIKIGGPTIFQWRAILANDKAFTDTQAERTRQQFAPNRNRTRS